MLAKYGLSNSEFRSFHLESRCTILLGIIVFQEMENLSVTSYNPTGELLCQMDAEEITAKRTAICSALATKALADPESNILAIIGAGVQAESHIQALSQLYSFSEVGKIWNCFQI